MNNNWKMILKNYVNDQLNMINQKEFYQTKYCDGVVVLDILSGYGTVVIVLKCLGIYIIKIVITNMTILHNLFFRQTTMLLC